MILKRENLKVGILYDVSKIPGLFPNAVHLKTTPEGYWKIDLFYDPDTKVFFTRGPFGRGDGEGFYLLDIKSVEEWDLRKLGHAEHSVFVDVNPMPKSQV